MKHSIGFTFNMCICYCEDCISACVEFDTVYDHTVAEAGSLFHIMLVMVGRAQRDYSLGNQWWLCCP